jgi:hypothetical protein
MFEWITNVIARLGYVGVATPIHRSNPRPLARATAIDAMATKEDATS